MIYAVEVKFMRCCGSVEECRYRSVETVEECRGSVVECRGVQRNAEYSMRRVMFYCMK